MRHVIVSSVSCPDIPYFSTLSHKLQDFGEILLNIKCVLIFLQLLFEIFPILRRVQ
jgi:hypothetical protein